MSLRTAGRLLLAMFVALSLADVDRLFAQTAGAGGAAAKPRVGAFRTGCTERDLDGAWGFLGSGAVLLSPVTGLAGPFSRVGRFVADGAGHLTFNSRAAFNGIHFHQEFTGIYTMKPDCTFTSFVTLPFSHPSIEPFTLHATFHGVISDQGKEMVDLFINPPGVTIFGRARKQSISRCTDRDLFGSYLFDQSGATLDLGFPLPFGSLGKIEADGNGRLSGQLVSNSGGFAVPTDISGTYTVASDCTFELAYCTFAVDGTTCLRNYGQHGVFLDDGASAYVIMTEPTTAVITGSLKQQ